MKITPCEHGLEHIGKSGPRTPGLHMSAIYNSLYQEMEPTRFIKGSAPDPLRLEAGLAFESFLEEAIKARLGNGGGRPGELISEEGILYNPDLLCFNGVSRVGEVKLTWMSSKEVPREPGNSFPPKFSKYLCQMMAYGRCLETPHGRLIAFFVNGTYKPMTPELLAWDITFSKREMDENWTMLMNHAKQRKML